MISGIISIFLINMKQEIVRIGKPYRTHTYYHIYTYNTIDDYINVSTFIYITSRMSIDVSQDGR
jgi:hypothetical protein